MKTRLISMFALLASTGLALAAIDPSGKQDLGVDISAAGKSATDHQNFVQSLPVDQQKKVRDQCLVIVSQPTMHAPQVVEFCKDVNSGPTTTAISSPDGQPIFATVSEDAALTYNLLGLEVYNAANDDVGTIKDLVLESQQVAGYIVSVGGFLGVGQHYVMIKPEAIQVTYDQAAAKWIARINATKDQLKSAPEFKYEGKFKQ